MAKNNIKNKRGFTIIEVVLVLAIAGLIFMMVFLALPALQRSQRDTQRSDDVARLASQLTQYRTDHRGALPGVPGSNDQNLYVYAKLNDEDNSIEYSGTDSWMSFYKTYLTQNGRTTFEDPGGNPYSLSIGSCKGLKGKDAACTAAAKKIDGSLANYIKVLVDGSNASGDSFDTQGNTITITAYAQCQGDNVVYTNGARQVAIRYMKESGGVICVSN